MLPAELYQVVQLLAAAIVQVSAGMHGVFSPEPPCHVHLKECMQAVLCEL